MNRPILDIENTICPTCGLEKREGASVTLTVTGIVDFTVQWSVVDWGDDKMQCLGHAVVEYMNKMESSDT